MRLVLGLVLGLALGANCSRGTFRVLLNICNFLVVSQSDSQLVSSIGFIGDTPLCIQHVQPVC